jgi:hypothetical protein
VPAAARSPPKPVGARVDIVERIAKTLSPDLGSITADSVARHLCAKHGVSGTGPLDPDKLKFLHETIRRGLVAFVGATRAEELATSCFSDLHAAR